MPLLHLATVKVSQPHGELASVQLPQVLGTRHKSLTDLESNRAIVLSCSMNPH